MLGEPGKQHALQATPSLLDAVDGLVHSRDHLLAVRVELRMARRHAAVHYLALDELALEVRSNKVEAAHTARVARRKREESACRRVPEGCREHLVVVDARLKGTALHTQPSLGRAISLELVHSYEFMDASARRYISPSNSSPRLIVRVIRQLLALSLDPDLTGLGGLAMSGGRTGRVST